MKFKELQLNDKILVALEKANFNEATEIQAKAIPLFLENKNIFGKSSTGTGKTASFVLPILQNLNQNERKIQAIIMAPTRELAMQIVSQIRIFGLRIENLVIAPLIGGTDMRDQIKRLKDAQIVVGTPGRVNDHLNRKTLNLKEVRTVILDEADEMLKMGFKSEIDALFEKISSDVQIGLFSATTSPKVMQIAKEYMNEYEVIEIQNQIQVNANITNTFIFTKGFSKEDLIIKVFEKHQPQRAIIFSNTKNHTDKIADNLKTVGIKAVVINGDKRQSQRSKAIAKFRNNEIKVLVATDVVARGIDITGVDFVINYDVSMEDEHFIHRIGRTGRNNTKGQSITFVQNQNVLRQIKGIEKNYNLMIDEMQISEYGDVERQQGRASSGRSGRGERTKSRRVKDDRRSAGHNDRRDFGCRERRKTSQRIDTSKSNWSAQSWEERILNLSPEEKEMAKKALSLVDDYADNSSNGFDRKKESSRGNDRKSSGRNDKRGFGCGERKRTSERNSNFKGNNQNGFAKEKDNDRDFSKKRSENKFERKRHSSWDVKTDYSKKDSDRWERVTVKEKRPNFDKDKSKDSITKRNNKRSSGRGEWVHSGPKENRKSSGRNNRSSSLNTSSKKPRYK
ncbi:DEAD/DEAH box helicase [Mesoplasma melaleucae]|uniref:DEAD-box ATP-dependent RNA helicase n=1 Tax=Mesoplasma melaleucae TaxID=81459 RepID=A0A2K8NWK0_9MOLU|nr:DEAD/DEAH box helicase [Mesoplasma melaleucae]ATZ18222.1 DEAD-box ATP-dependent RNA helicase [Mesoplasma melaleucae]